VKFYKYFVFFFYWSVCELMSTGVAGIFGPQSEDTAEHVQSVCDTMEVPHIEMRWDLSQRRGACAVNLFPHPSVLARVSIHK
jgi:glutamate receptor, ionotropic, invertebrate